jgi:hypothetical protein
MVVQVKHLPSTVVLMLVVGQQVGMLPAVEDPEAQAVVPVVDTISMVREQETRLRVIQVVVAAAVLAGQRRIPTTPAATADLDW